MYNQDQVDTSQAKELYPIPDDLPKKIKSYCFAMALQHHQVVIAISEDSIIALAFSNKEQKLVVADEWLFKKIKYAHKLIRKYFYIITTDNKIGIFEFHQRVTRKLSIEPLTQLIPYESYFEHEVRANVMQLHIFKNQFELKICQFTANGKYTIHQMILQNRQGNTYKIQKQQKHYLFCSKNFVNKSRRIILTRTSAKTQKFLIMNFPEQMHIIVGLAGKQEYVAFTNKFEHFNPLGSKSLNKMYISKDFSKFVPANQGIQPKFTNIYVKNNNMIMGLQDNKTILIVSLSSKGIPKIIGRQFGRYDALIFGVDYTQLIAVFNKNTLKRTKIKMKQIPMISKTSTNIKKLQSNNNNEVTKTAPYISPPPQNLMPANLKQPKDQKKQYSLKSQDSKKNQNIEKLCKEKSSDQQSKQSIDSDSPDKFFTSESNERSIFVNESERYYRKTSILDNKPGYLPAQQQKIKINTKQQNNSQQNISKEQHKQQKSVTQIQNNQKFIKNEQNPFKIKKQLQNQSISLFGSSNNITSNQQSQKQVYHPNFSFTKIGYNPSQQTLPKQKQQFKQISQSTIANSKNPFKNINPFSAIFLPEMNKTTFSLAQIINQKLPTISVKQQFNPIKDKIFVFCDRLLLSTNKIQQSCNRPIVLQLNAERILSTLQQHLQKQYNSKQPIDLNKFRGKLIKFNDTIQTNNFINTGNFIKKQNEVLKKNTLKTFYPESFLHTSNEQFNNLKNQLLLRMQNSRLETKDRALQNLNEWGKNINQINNVLEVMKQQIQQNRMRVDQRVAIRQEFGKQIDLIKQEIQNRIAQKLKTIQNKQKIKPTKMNNKKSVKIKNDEPFMSEDTFLKQKSKKHKTKKNE